MIFPFLHFREQQEPCIAQGPSIKQARTWQADYRGSRFSLALPRSNAETYEPDKSSHGSYGPDNNTARYLISRWSGQGFTNREYRYWGPRGIGEVNSMSFTGWFSRIREPKAGLSLFHPQAFEFALPDYIEDRLINCPPEDYVTRVPNTVKVPIEWKAFNHLPGPTAYFKIDTGNIGDLNYYFATVLDDHDLLFLGFSLGPNRFGPKHIPREEWVDMRNMKRLMFDVFNSLTLELSPEAEARRLRAISGMKDTSLKKKFETQNFYIHPERISGVKPEQAQAKIKP